MSRIRYLLPSLRRVMAIVTLVVLPTIALASCDLGGPNIVTGDIQSTEVRLQDLVISPGTLSPAFDLNTTSYDVAAGSATTITVTARTNVAGVRLRVNSDALTNGIPSNAIPLAVGSNTIVITVTAADEISTGTYTLNVVRTN